MGYEINDDSLSARIFFNLLELNGLVQIFPFDNEEKVPQIMECDINTTLVAAFITNPTFFLRMYHFFRFFKNGWWESLGTDIKYRNECKEILFADKTDIESYFDCQEMDFIGYFLVPPSVQLADKLGRPFTFEYHKK